MLEAININSQQPNIFSSPFQARLVDHWLEIKGRDILPLKRSFRPQLFPNYLSQFAMISLGDTIIDHETRIIGTAVTEVLALTNPKANILATRNPYLSQNLEKMLQTAATVSRPSYYRMTLDHDRRLSSFEFTILALPFASSPHVDTYDIMILAFDFSGSDEVNMLKNLASPLVVPTNRSQLI